MLEQQVLPHACARPLLALLPMSMAIADEALLSSTLLQLEDARKALEALAKRPSKGILGGGGSADEALATELGHYKRCNEALQVV